MPANDSLPLGIATAGLSAFGGRYDPIKALFGHKKAPEYDPLDPRNPNYAQNALARFTTGEYNDYVRNINPIEDDLLAYARDKTQPDKAAQQGIADVNASFDQIPGQLQRRNQGLGLTLSPEEQAAQQRSLATQRGLASATAANRGAQGAYATQDQILGGAQSQANVIRTGLQGAQQP